MIGQLMPLVGGFIGLIVILSIGTMVLGNSTFNCTTVPGYNTTAPSAGEIKNGSRTNHAMYSNSIGFQTGWPKACLDSNASAVNGYALLIISVIVFAAVIILSIVRLLS